MTEKSVAAFLVFLWLVVFPLMNVAAVTIINIVVDVAIDRSNQHDECTSNLRTWECR